MHLRPAFLASILSGFYGRRPPHSWDDLSELARRSEGVALDILRSRQTLPPTHQLPEYTISLPLDHNGETNITFNNRFWVNATYYEPGGPVIFFDIGESSGEDIAMVYLTEPNAPGPVMSLASRYKGLAIAWEHRFYGESFPSNSSKTFSPDWKYFTIQQALDDVVVFANSFSNSTSLSANATNLFDTYAIHPSKVPWIAVSGSYPGARIAFLREKHPEVFFAGWGSSVCSGGEVLSPGYFTTIQQTLPSNCSADWAAIRQYIDEQLLDGSPEALAKLRFGGDEIDVLLLPTYDFQSLGRELTTDMFCDQLETMSGTRKANPRGLAAELGIEAAYKAYADIVEPIYNMYRKNEGSDSDSDDRYDYDSWTYQTCTEYGSFRVYDPDDADSFVSTQITEASELAACRQNFTEFVPATPRVEVLNDLGGRDVNPSNFFFTDGEIDPWRIVTPSWPKKQGVIRTASESRPKCNTRPPLNHYFGKVYPGTTHMPDHKTYINPALASRPDLIARNTKVFKTSLELFQQALDEWLPCFFEMPPGHIGDGHPVDSGARSLELGLGVVVLWALGVIPWLYSFL